MTSSQDREARPVRRPVPRTGRMASTQVSAERIADLAGSDNIPTSNNDAFWVSGRASAAPEATPGEAFLPTVHDIFRGSASIWGDRPFLAVGPLATRPYLKDGIEYTYAQTARIVEGLRGAYAAAGYGHGHRVGLLLENRPDHHLHFLALNALGVSIVPINPDYRPDEIRYLIEHSELSLIVALPERVEDLAAVARGCIQRPPVISVDGADALPGPATAPPLSGVPDVNTEASLLYTSGTTGRPKGCVIPNDYYTAVGRLYLEAGGLVDFRPGAERIFNPLPLFHMNAGVLTFMGAMRSGGCAIMPDRFHSGTWWQELRDARATIFHYLGVIPAMLMKLPEAPGERNHSIRFAIGAGVEPELHQPFEERFGVPLVELWGMTETGGGFVASHEPRLVDTRAMGRPGTREGLDLEVRIVGPGGEDVPRGEAGELLVRRYGAKPRKGFFSEYLKNPEATRNAWLGGYFHTGDVVRQDESGMLFFVDRNKNIIRRSGENIAAAEIEAVLLAHDAVAQAAVVAAPDELRQEEVMACIVVKEGLAADEALAVSLFDWCNERLAYYKPPGWVLFLDELPKTSTQKVQKSQLFKPDEDPRRRSGAIDLRTRKRRAA